jgi:hypothetical protein
VSGVDPAGFPAEAERLADRLHLDFGVAGVERVQAWVAVQPDDASRILAGCYVGEVLRRALGGEWTADGTLVGVGHVAETAPLAKARAGEDLAAYVADVVRYAS